MGFFKRIKAPVLRPRSSSPPSYDSTEPPICEKHLVYNTMEDKPTAAEPLIEVQIHKDRSFKIHIRILEEKAPEFLQKCRKSGTLVSTLSTSSYGSPMTSDFFAHWLQHSSFSKNVLANRKDKAQIANQTTALATLFLMAQDYGIVQLMDLIMDVIVGSKSKLYAKPDVVLSYYDQTSGPCGLRLFVIRSLAYRIYNHPGGNQTLPLHASDFEIFSRSPEIMKDVFQVWASQAYAGTTPKHPEEYPPCSYHHERFVATQ